MHFQIHIVGVPGTGVACGRGEEPVAARDTEYHRIFDFRAAKGGDRNKKNQDVAGCAIMIPKQDAVCVREIMYPGDTDLQGRGGGICAPCFSQKLINL